MLVYSNGNAAALLKNNSELDPDKTAEFVHELFPQEKLTAIDDGNLSYTCPPDDIIYAGYFSGVYVISAKEFGIDYPSKLHERFQNKKYGNTIQLHAMHSVVDWFALAVWENGKLERSLSLSPDSGILEDIGEKLPFEASYWNGEHPAIDPEEEEDAYPFQFHPLELGEAALNEFFGYVLEGFVDSSHIEPENIPLLGFKRAKCWWKFW
ncbi:MAG: DUF6928 family protein [Arenicellales bacterium]